MHGPPGCGEQGRAGQGRPAAPPNPRRAQCASRSCPPHARSGSRLRSPGHAPSALPLAGRDAIHPTPRLPQSLIGGGAADVTAGAAGAWPGPGRAQPRGLEPPLGGSRSSRPGARAGPGPAREGAARAWALPGEARMQEEPLLGHLGPFLRDFATGQSDPRPAPTSLWLDSNL